MTLDNIKYLNPREKFKIFTAPGRIRIRVNTILLYLIAFTNAAFYCVAKKHRVIRHFLLSRPFHVAMSILCNIQMFQRKAPRKYKSSLHSREHFNRLFIKAFARNGLYLRGIIQIFNLRFVLNVSQIRFHVKNARGKYN